MTRGRHRRRLSPDRRALVVSLAGIVACIVLFFGLRMLIVHAHGPTAFDVWIGDGLRTHDRPRLLVAAEHFAALPGSRKGAALIALAIGAWAWLRDRDARPGTLLIAAFTGTTATIALLKSGVDNIWPMDGASGEALERAFVSTHTANAAAVFGMLAVVVVLRPWRDILRPVAGAGAVVVLAVAVAVAAAGHHYVTDVVSGVAVAGMWVFALVPVAARMYRPVLARARSPITLDSRFDGRGRSLALPPMLPRAGETAARRATSPTAE